MGHDNAALRDVRLEPTQDRVTRIRELEASADRLEQAADQARWEAAELIAAELDSGKTLRGLGEEIGKSHPHVHRMAQVWRDYGGTRGTNPSSLPSFNTLYQHVKRVSEPEPQLWKRESPKGRPPPHTKDFRKELRSAEEAHALLDDLVLKAKDESRDPGIADVIDKATLTRLRMALRFFEERVPEDDPAYERWEAAFQVSLGKTPKPLRKTPPPSMIQGRVVSVGMSA